MADQSESRVRLRLKPQVAHPYKSLEQGETDLLIIPEKFCSPDHPLDHLFDDEFVCVMWKDSDIAQQELNEERYLNARHVTMRPNDDSLPFFEAWFTENVDVDRRVSVSTYSFGTIPHMVVGTELVGTVHSRLARKLERALPIVVRPIPLPVLRFSQTMQWHKYRTRDPGLMWLRGLLHEAARTLDDTQA